MRHMRIVHPVTSGRRIAFAVMLALLVTGCNGLDRLLGTEKKKDHRHQFYIVAACQDDDGMGGKTLPPFLPATHVALIQRVEKACAENDCQIDGDTWITARTDCGHGRGYVGDQYYAGRGY